MQGNETEQLWRQAKNLGVGTEKEEAIPLINKGAVDLQVIMEKVAKRSDVIASEFGTRPVEHFHSGGYDTYKVDEPYLILRVRKSEEEIVEALEKQKDVVEERVRKHRYDMQNAKEHLERETKNLEKLLELSSRIQQQGATSRAIGSGI